MVELVHFCLCTEQAKICPDEMLYRGFCYRVLSAETYSMSVSTCKNLGGHLAVLEGSDVFSYVKKQLSAHNVTPET